MDVTDWLIGVGTIGTLILAVAAFLSIRENRRQRLEERQIQALMRIRSWAATVSEAVALGKSHADLREMIDGLRTRLQPMAAVSFGIEADARRLGGDIEQVVELATDGFLELWFRLCTEDELATQAALGAAITEDAMKGIADPAELAIAVNKLNTMVLQVIRVTTRRLVPNK